MDKEVFEKIIKKKEFSQLPRKDVLLAWKKFQNRQVSDEEKIRLTRELLHKVFSSFTSHKILSDKDKSADWILRKHLSTRERLPYYRQVYKRILNNFQRNFTLIDLGAGINGFSYGFFNDLGFKVKYLGIESIGQLVKLQNDYFKKKNICGEVYHFSLFELEKVKNLMRKSEKPRLVFLLKMIGPLEQIEKDYSLKLISEAIPFAERMVVSFATESMIKRIKFKWNRVWLTSFLERNFKILDDFELGGERYLVFSKN